MLKFKFITLNFNPIKIITHVQSVGPHTTRIIKIAIEMNDNAFSGIK